MKAIGTIMLLASVLLSPGVHAAQPSDAELTDIGREYARIINARDVRALDELTDFDRYAERAIAPIQDTPGNRTALLLEVLRGLRSQASREIAQHQQKNAVARYLRIHTIRDIRGPLIRVDNGGGGFAFILLVLERESDDAPLRIIDHFRTVDGQLTSESHGALIELVRNPSESSTFRLLGNRRVDTLSQAAMARIGSAYLAGDYAAAYEALAQLPDETRNGYLLNSFSLQLAMRVSKEAYVQELARLGEHHGDDPRAASQLIDYFFYKGDFAAVLNSIDRLESLVGEDAMLLLVKTNISVAAGDKEGAIRYGRRAVELEPDKEEAHWSLLNAQLAMEWHRQSVSTMRVLEDEFGNEFTPDMLREMQVSQAFLESPAYQRWLKDRASK